MKKRFYQAKKEALYWAYMVERYGKCYYNNFRASVFRLLVVIEYILDPGFCENGFFKELEKTYDRIDTIFSEFSYKYNKKDYTDYYYDNNPLWKNLAYLFAEYGA